MNSNDLFEQEKVVNKKVTVKVLGKPYVYLMTNSVEVLYEKLKKLGCRMPKMQDFTLNQHLSADVINIMKELGASFSVTTSNNASVLNFISSTQGNYIVQLDKLKESNILNKENNESNSQLENICDDQNLLLKNIDKIDDVNVRNITGKSLLIIAVYLNNKEAVEALIQRNADLNIRDQNGYTALMYSIIRKNNEIANILLTQNVDVNAKNNMGNTALILAAKDRNISLIEPLLKSGANINSKDDFGWNSLMWASSKNYKEIVELLINKGADIKARDSNGFTAYAIAVSRKSTDVEDIFIKQGVNIKNEFAMILMTSENDNTESLIKLLSSETNSTSKENDKAEFSGGSFSSRLNFYIDRYCRQTGNRQSKIYQYNENPNCLIMSKQDFSRIISKSNKSQNYRPKKDQIILLSIGMKLNIDEVNDLLNSAGFHFSDNKVDIIIKGFFLKKDYNIFNIDEAVYRYTGKPFFKNKLNE